MKTNSEKKVNYAALINSMEGSMSMPGEIRGNFSKEAKSRLKAFESMHRYNDEAMKKRCNV